MNFKDVHAKTSRIEGWLSKGEAKVLYRLASLVESGLWIVEIGCYKGLSTVYLAEGSNIGKGAHILSVDTFEGSSEHRKGGKKVWTYDDFLSNIKKSGLEKIVHPVKNFSVNAEKEFVGSAGLIFIDASHEYDDVVNDFKSWAPHLKDGGFIAMHDTIMWEGPKRAAAELLFRSPDYRVIGFSHSLSYGVKKRKRPVDFMYAEFVLFLKNCYEILYRVKRAVISYFR